MNMVKYINTLSQGSTLHGKSYSYCIEQVLGQGSFGITYLASVKMQGTLGSIDAKVKVAVKEFFKKEINGHKGTYKNDKEYNGKWYFLGSNELYSEVINGKEIVK